MQVGLLARLKHPNKRIIFGEESRSPSAFLLGQRGRERIDLRFNNGVKPPAIGNQRFTRNAISLGPEPCAHPSNIPLRLKKEPTNPPGSRLATVEQSADRMSPHTGQHRDLDFVFVKGHQPISLAKRNLLGHPVTSLRFGAPPKRGRRNIDGDHPGRPPRCDQGRGQTPVIRSDIGDRDPG